MDRFSWDENTKFEDPPEGRRNIHSNLRIQIMDRLWVGCVSNRNLLKNQVYQWLLQTGKKVSLESIWNEENEGNHYDYIDIVAPP